MAEATFARPHRTWGMRLVNRAGASLRRRGHERPLVASAILDAARRRTGQSDFGDEFFLEPMSRLIRALEDEARLTSFGRLLLRRSLVNFAANRLRVQRDLARAPRLLERPVSRPIFVLGLPRTGTTLLQELLACDPGLRALLCWESFFPAPVSRRSPPLLDLRLPMMRAIVRGLDGMAPQLRDVHPLTADAPEECTWLTANTFMSSAFSLMGRVPSYEAWLDGEGDALADRAYADFARQLQLLQASSGDRPWILKSPVHLRALGPLLRAFPDARVIQTHREPAKVVPSTCSLFAIMRGIYSDDVDPAALGPEILGKLAAARARSEAARVTGGDRVFDVSFADLVKDPVETVRRARRHFGDDVSPAAEQAMRAWLARHPQPKGHHYSLEQFGLSPAQVEAALPQRS